MQTLLNSVSRCVTPSGLVGLVPSKVASVNANATDWNGVKRDTDQGDADDEKEATEYSDSRDEDDNAREANDEDDAVEFIDLDDNHEECVECEDEDEESNGARVESHEYMAESSEDDMATQDMEDAQVNRPMNGPSEIQFGTVDVIIASFITKGN